MKIGAIILSRLDSLRLPGKALREVDGIPLLGHVIEMCRKVKGLDKIILATSNRECDSAISNVAAKYGIEVFRGNIDNVARRFLSCMEDYNLDYALRVNGDSPLNNPVLLSKGIELVRKSSADMVTNVLKRTYPYGMSLEVIAYKAMKKAFKLMTDCNYKNHVTKFFYDYPELFNIKNIESGKKHYEGVQLAVDIFDDFKRFEWIYNHIKLLATNTFDADVVVDLAMKYNSNMCDGKK